MFRASQLGSSSGKPAARAAIWTATAAARAKSEWLEPTAGRALRIVFAPQDELFPQAAAVLPCEFPGQVVEVAHPLHGDQERLVGGEPGRAQLGDLVAKMILQLVDVTAVDARGLRDVGPPLCDL